MDSNKEISVVISPKTVIVLLLTVLGLWFLFIIRDILLLVAMVIIFVAAVSPIIRSWQKYVGRPAAITLFYLLLVLTAVGVMLLIVPPASQETYNLIKYIQLNYATSAPVSSILDNVRQSISAISNGNYQGGFGSIIQQFSGSLGTVYDTTISVITAAVSAVTVLVISFYLLLDEARTQAFLISLLPAKHQKKIVGIIEKISGKIGDWLRGQVYIMAIVAFLVGVGMAVIGMPYAITLGVLSGLAEIIPIVGPTIGAVPGVILAFALKGPVYGLIALVIYIVVEQIEGHILVPKIIGKSIGISPVVIIFGLLIGAKLFGLIGVFLSVPVMAALNVIYHEWSVAETNE